MNEIIKTTPYSVPVETMTTEQILNEINIIGDKIVSVANNIATIHKEMHIMDLQFEAYIASLDNDIENRILDRVLQMEVNTPLDMEHKMRMMEIVDRYLNQIGNLTMQLLL